MRTPPRLTGLAAGVVLVVGVGGCGGNASSASTPPASTTVTATSTSSAPSETPTTPSATPSTTPSAAPARCTLADLRFKASEGDGAMGSVYVDLVMTNTGPAPCVTGGYGGVALVDAARHRLGAPAKRDASVTAARIVLQPGRSARAQLKIGVAENYDPAACRPKPAKGIQVIPPNETHSVVVPYDTTGCAKSGIVLMSLQPYRAG